MNSILGFLLNPLSPNILFSPMLNANEKNLSGVPFFVCLMFVNNIDISMLSKTRIFVPKAVLGLKVFMSNRGKEIKIK